MRVNINGQRIRVKPGQSIRTVDGQMQVIDTPAKEREQKVCEGCGGPMLVAPGQEARFHKECRNKR